jgi:hypothetical protein
MISLLRQHMQLGVLLKGTESEDMGRGPNSSCLTTSAVLHASRAVLQGPNQATSTTACQEPVVMQLQAQTGRSTGLTRIAGAQHSMRAGSRSIGAQAKTSGQASAQAALLPVMVG